MRASANRGPSRVASRRLRRPEYEQSRAGHVLKRKPAPLGSREQVFDPDRRKPSAEPPLATPLAGTSARAPARGGNTSRGRGARRSTSRPRSAARAAGRSTSRRSCRRRRASPPAGAPGELRRKPASSDRGARCSKTSTAIDPVEARRAEGQPAGRGADPIDARRLIRASPPRGPARPPTRPARQAPWQTGPCRSPGRGRGGRRAATDCRRRRAAGDRPRPTLALNRPWSASNREATTASCSAIMRPSPPGSARDASRPAPPPKRRREHRT